LIPYQKDIRLFSQDESRFGLLPVQRKMITLKGVKPISHVQYEFKSSYIYGAVEPKTGEHFFLELPYLDTTCFQIYIDEFSRAYPDSFNIMLLDRGRFHRSKSLRLPSNIAFIFLPAYSPELNPIERVWEAIKAEIANELYLTMENLMERIASILCSYSTANIQPLTSYPYFINAVNDVLQ